ncbi:MAG: type I restriction enzyme HsdR N-terminal domain-containing protein [Bacteroidales bacterium]|nr:type I restriction enzyme HsdR N-terminal domain-containing protein [Bacteroidales bacterium]
MVWDPLRKKEVPLTPEEKVRQWFIGVLRDNAGVPVHMMMSEVGLGERALRADIVVYGRDASPLTVVECKRPEVQLDTAVLEQALKYYGILKVKYIIITNGTATYVFKRGEKGFVQEKSLPQYGQML